MLCLKDFWGEVGSRIWNEMYEPEWLLRDSKELKPRTKTTINDHGFQEHRRWSDPQPTVAVERPIDHIFLFRF